MSSFNGRRRCPTTSGLALAGIAVVALSGCVRYVAQPIDLQQRRDHWARLDARSADEAVRAAMAAGALPDQAYDLTDGIDLAEAETTALFFNPSIRATRLEAGVPAAAAAHAGRWADPELGVDGDYILDQVDEPWVLGGTLSITIPLSGRQGVARRLAADRAAAAAATVVGAEWALLQTVRERWLRLAVAEARIRLLEAADDEIQSLIAAAPSFRAAAAMTVVDERRFRIQQVQLRDDLAQARAHREELRLQLVAAMGLHPAHDWRLQAAVGDLDALERDAAVDVLGHPELRLMMAAYQVAERSLHLEVRKQYPDLVIGFGGGSEEGDSRLLFGLGLLPIPLWNANREGIATATAERALVAARIDGAIQDLVHRAHDNQRRTQRSAERRRLVEEELVPLVDAQVADAKRLGGLGQLDLFLLADALEQARAVRLQLLAVRADERLVNLERLALMGPPLIEEEAAP